MSVGRQRNGTREGVEKPERLEAGSALWMRKSTSDRGVEMSQTQTSKAVAADERTEAARSFVRTVKAAARRKYTPEEKIRIVLEGFRARLP